MGTKTEEVQTVAKVASDGRITLPLRIRKALGIDIGDDVLVSVRKLD